MKCSKITTASVCGMFAWERKAPLGIQRKQFYSGASLLPPPMPLVEIFNLLSSGSVRAQYPRTVDRTLIGSPAPRLSRAVPLRSTASGNLRMGHVPVSTRTFFFNY